MVFSVVMSVTLRETAPRAWEVATVARVASVAAEAAAAMVVAMEVVKPRPATLAAASATCPVSS
jgi:hypothetical protein